MNINPTPRFGTMTVSNFDNLSQAGIALQRTNRNPLSGTDLLTADAFQSWGAKNKGLVAETKRQNDEVTLSLRDAAKEEDFAAVLTALGLKVKTRPSVARCHCRYGGAPPQY